MKISKRLEDGWSEPMSNKSKDTCDSCGSGLYIAPHNGLYCDKVHTDVCEWCKKKPKHGKSFACVECIKVLPY